MTAGLIERTLALPGRDHPQQDFAQIGEERERG